MTRIICGDCAGYELVPRQTWVTSRGVCSGCGGSSFVLAGDLCRVLSDLIRLGAVDRAALAEVAQKPVVGRAVRRESVHTVHAALIAQADAYHRRIATPLNGGSR